MRNKINKKFVLFIPIIVVIIGLLSAIYFIDLSRFLKNHKDYDETYMLKMMYLIADEKITSEEDTIPEVANYDNDKALFAMNEVIPLEKKGDYLYAYLDEFTNDKLLEKTTDVSFAKNNDFGEVIDGCEYDKKTKTIKIPFSYYEDIGEYEVPIEAQILSLMSVEDLMSMEVDVSTKNFVTKTRKVGANNLSMVTEIPLYNSNLSGEDLDVYVNNSGYSVPKKYIEYDKDSSVLILYMPAILIDKVDIKSNKPVLPSVSALTGYTAANMNALEVSDRPNIPTNGYKIVDAWFYNPDGSRDPNLVNAVTCHDYNGGSANMGVMCSGGTDGVNGMNINALSSTTNNPFSFSNFTMFYSYTGRDHSYTQDTLSNAELGSADANTLFYKTDYTVSNTYAMRLKVFDSDPTFTSGSDFEANKSNDEYKNNSPRILTFKDNAFGGGGTVSASNMKDYWISLHCVSSPTASAAGQSANLYFKLSNIYEDSSSMIVKIQLQYNSNSANEQNAYLKNQGYTSTQGAIGYVKFQWQNKCKARPRKMKTLSSPLPEGAEITYELHEGYAAADGKSCPGTLLETKTFTITDSNVFNRGDPEDYYADTSPNVAGGFSTELTVGNVYCMQETSFKLGTKDLLTYDFNPSSYDTSTYKVDDFAAENENGDEWCDKWPGIINTERTYCYTIKKVDAESTSTVVKGSSWKMTGQDGTVYTASDTDNDGIITFTGLKHQNYSLVETTDNPASLGGVEYWNDHTSVETIYGSAGEIPQDVTADSLTEGDSCTANVKKNTKTYYCLKVKKVDYVTGAALDGAEFKAQKGNTTITSSDTTNYKSNAGIVSLFLGDSSGSGNWTITETKAPDGYDLDGTSKSIQAIRLKEYATKAAARNACLSSTESDAVAYDNHTIAAHTYNSTTNNSTFKDKKRLINWFKTTENNTPINGAKYIVSYVDNGTTYYIKASSPVSVTDSSSTGVTKACYQYTGRTTNQSEAVVLTGGEAGSTNITMTGETCVSGIPAGTYTVKEIQAPDSHTLDSNSTITIEASTVFNTNKKQKNYPTEFRFTKEVTNTNGTQEDNTQYTVTIGGVTKTVSLSEMTTEELKKIGFTIYDSNGNAVPVKEISSGYYEYGNNSVDQVGTSSNVTVLHLDDKRQIYVKHLPRGSYTLKEVDTSSCALSNGGYGTIASPNTRPSSAPSCSNGIGSGNGTCIGYYSPDYSSNSSYKFTINDCSSVNASSNPLCNNGGVVTKSFTNTPTEVILTKKDLYEYKDAADVIDKDREKDSNETTAEFENAKERSDFDRIDFKVKDSNGNYLNFIYVGNNGSCSSDSDYSVYRYVPGLALPSGVNPDVFNYHANNEGLTITQTLHACGGHIKLINLCRGETYTFEEVKVPDDSVYVKQKEGELNPEACFEVPCSTNENEHRTSTTAIINDKPTRVTFEKKDAKYNYLIPDETTTFEVYRCPKGSTCNPSAYSSVEEREQAGMKLIKFEPRSIITNDEEDPGLEVYRMMSDSDAENKSLCADNQTSNCYVTSIHPEAGRLVLRYLQSGYNYVLLETVAPVNYILPTGTDAETPFKVVNTTVDVEEVNVPNSPTAIIIRKYADIDGDGQADSGKLLGGAKFRIYKVTNYNANKKPQDQEMIPIKLKTIKDGIYENRPVLDTDVVTTCTGDNCSYNPTDLGYLDTPWENIDDLIEKSGNDVTSVLQEGTALIQYLEYDTYYVIREVEAPVGYSLPEKEDNQYTLVHIKENETEILDTRDALVNKPTSFTFYKFDEYNTPLDGATFYLQKLDNEKKYNTLTVSKETLEDGSTIYRADPDSELTDITTSGGSATVYYLEPGQYRILEVKAADGYELPKKTINVATFFVDEDGLVFGSNIITNKKPNETIEYLAESKAELVINIQTGKIVIKYGLIITLLIGSIVGLIIFLKKRK